MLFPRSKKKNSGWVRVCLWSIKGKLVWVRVGLWSIKIKLDQLKPGQRGKVVSVSGQDMLRQRLMAMGLVKGVDIETVKIAPFGDPIEFEVKDYNLSLRKNEAHNIEVEVTDAAA